MAPALPAEIVSYIAVALDHAAKEPNAGRRMRRAMWLRSLALVSRAWVGPCQQLLFRAFSLGSDTPLCLPRLVFLATNAHLGALIRHIDIEDYIIPVRQLEVWLPYAFPYVQTVILSFLIPRHVGPSSTMEWKLPCVMLKAMSKLKYLIIWLGNPTTFMGEVNLDNVPLHTVRFRVCTGDTLSRLITALISSQATSSIVKDIAISAWSRGITGVPSSLVEDLVSACTRLEVLDMLMAGFEATSRSMIIRSDTLRTLQLQVNADEQGISHLRDVLRNIEAPSFRVLHIRFLGRGSSMWEHTYWNFLPFGQGLYGQDAELILRPAVAEGLSSLTISFIGVQRVMAYSALLALFGTASRPAVLCVEADEVVLDD